MYHVSKRVAWKFKFGYHSVDDMIQQGVLEILSPDKNGRNILDKYDGSRPLSNFLYIHVRNRLFNFKRDNYVRPYIPCENCPLEETLSECGKRCSKFEVLEDCEILSSWIERNSSRRNIMNTLGLDQINDYTESNTRYYLDIDKEIDMATILDLIESELPMEYREDYTHLKYGHTLSKMRLDNLKVAVCELLGEEDDPDV